MVVIRNMGCSKVNGSSSGVLERLGLAEVSVPGIVAAGSPVIMPVPSWERSPILDIVMLPFKRVKKKK